MSNFLLVISHYNSRPKNLLKKLIESTENLKIDRLIVINDDHVKKNNLTKKSANLFFLSRPNIGMNIGGWNDAFFTLSNYEFYVFIQDECLILDDGFIYFYKDLLNEKGIGMIGESMNPKWNESWEILLNSPLNSIDNDHLENGLPLPRVAFYLSMLKKWSINPSENASHLRSLIWGFKNNVLQQINGFPVGSSKGECIAAEIGVSKKIEAIGLQIQQVKKDPFSFIYHTEWNKNGYSKL